MDDHNPDDGTNLPMDVAKANDGAADPSPEKHPRLLWTTIFYHMYTIFY